MTWLLSLLLACAPARAVAPGDGVIVNFKDGSRLSGTLVELGADSVAIDVGGAVATWKLDGVSSVLRRATPAQTFLDLVKAAGDDDAKLAQAAEFARANGLDTYYDQLAARLGWVDGLPEPPDDSSDRPAPPEPQADAEPEQAASTAAAGGYVPFSDQLAPP